MISGRATLTEVYIPSITMVILSSLKVAVGLAFTGAIVGEFVPSRRGLGYLLNFAQSSFNAALTLALGSVSVDVATGWRIWHDCAPNGHRHYQSHCSVGWIAGAGSLSAGTLQEESYMRPLVEFAKTTLIGGILIVLPVYVAVLLLAKAVSALLALLKPIIPASVAFGGVFAVLLLAIICFIVGLMVRTGPGLRLKNAFEKAILSKLPGYTILRGLAARVDQHLITRQVGWQGAMITFVFGGSSLLLLVLRWQCSVQAGLLLGNRLLLISPLSSCLRHV